MGKIWNTDEATLYRDGRGYKKGDDIPELVITRMGKETVNEYTEKDWISDGKTQTEPVDDADGRETPENAEDGESDLSENRDELIKECLECGLKPHHNAGIPKLKEMLENHKAFEDLKTQAAELDIEVTDDMSMEDLQELVDDALED